MSPAPFESSGPATNASAGSGWWSRAVVYQVYIRSFADGDGDGIGDIAGIRSRLPYLRDLGVDGIWITPWYPSPMADGGYDVADYRAVDPRFGTLADAEALVREAHAFGLRVLLDIVPNHTSEAHPWFEAARTAAPGSPERARYIFAAGRGRHGDDPPNNWPSIFGGPAWERVAEGDGRPGEWFLHLFAPEQPDLNWANPEVRADFERTLAFWFDRGVDGFRIDVAHGLVKEEGYPDAPPEALDGSPLPAGGHPGWDRPGVHEVHREWRRVADGHGDGRVLVGEVGVEEAERLVDYLRPDELHGAFNFPYMGTPWDGAALRSVIDASLRAHDRVGARPTWLLSNHDATRQVTRLGRPFSGFQDRAVDDLQVADIELGTRRARAAILLTLALPGQAFLYQGEELGLWEVEDLPEASLEDPIWERTGHVIRGRDGCRVPMPWEGQAPPFGFGPRGAKPWLPQPAAWRNLTVEAQAADPASMLSLYRAALRLRREHPGFAAEAFRWLPSPRGVLMFERGGGLRCVANLSSTAWRVPGEARPILASATIDGGLLPVDGAAWLEARDRT